MYITNFLFAYLWWNIPLLLCWRTWWDDVDDEDETDAEDDDFDDVVSDEEDEDDTDKSFCIIGTKFAGDIDDSDDEDNSSGAIYMTKSSLISYWDGGLALSTTSRELTLRFFITTNY